MSSDIDPEAARAALIEACGSVWAAARKMNIPTPELRRLVTSHPKLIEAALELEEQALDEAEAIVRKALRSPVAAERLMAAGHLLRTSPAALRRGWRRPRGYLAEEAAPEPVALKWQDEK
jgi:hypothetical protein